MRECFIAVALLLVATSATAQAPRAGRPGGPPATSDGILVVFPAEDVAGGGRGFKYKTTTQAGTIIDPNALGKAFQDFLQQVGRAFSPGTLTLPGGYAIEEVQLQVIVTAEGSFGLIANAKAGTSGAITLVLKRPSLIKP